MFNLVGEKKGEGKTEESCNSFLGGVRSAMGGVRSAKVVEVRTIPHQQKQLLGIRKNFLENFYKSYGNLKG